MPKLTASQEDYLEAIHLLTAEGRDVCVRDIAARIGVAMPSVTGALRKLAAMRLVRHGRYDYVVLTAEGTRRAAAVASRHTLLKRFLMSTLGVDEHTAERDACAIEHHVSDATVQAIVRTLNTSAGSKGAR